MPPLRIEYPGAVYHVTSRGNEKKPVFRDDKDRLNFLNTIRHVNKRYNWICQAYCLMTNHYHLLIETLTETFPSVCGISTTSIRSFSIRCTAEAAISSKGGEIFGMLVHSVLSHDIASCIR
jgi:REP element-mobilizing transposase RayT